MAEHVMHDAECDEGGRAPASLLIAGASASPPSRLVCNQIFWALRVRRAGTAQRAQRPQERGVRSSA